MKKRRENKPHLGMKYYASTCFRQCGWITKFEECDVDVVAFRPGLSGILAIECEGSRGNVLRNIEKDFERGCDRLLILCESKALLSQIRRILTKVSETIARRVTIATTDQLNPDFIRRTFMETHK